MSPCWTSPADMMISSPKKRDEGEVINLLITILMKVVMVLLLKMLLFSPCLLICHLLMWFRRFKFQLGKSLLEVSSTISGRSSCSCCGHSMLLTRAGFTWSCGQSLPWLSHFTFEASTSNHVTGRKKKSKDPLDFLSNSEEGDFRGAIRLARSEDSMAGFNDVTLCMLKEKYPSPTPNQNLSVIQTLKEHHIDSTLQSLKLNLLYQY